MSTCSSSHGVHAEPLPIYSRSITNQQEHLARRARRRRRRALRMSREKQIPELARHCASYMPSFSGRLQSFSHRKDGNFGQFSHNHGNSGHSLKYIREDGLEPPSALARYLGRPPLKSRELSFNQGSGGEGDASDVSGLDLFELPNRPDESSSSLSSSSNGSPHHFTGTCSTHKDAYFHHHVESSKNLGLLNARGMGMKIDDEGGDNVEHDKKKRCDGYDLSAEYWKLHADVLAAECNLLEVEKELALRRWKQGCVDMAARAHSVIGDTKRMPMQWKKERDGSYSSWHTFYEEGADQGELENLHDISGWSNSFAVEALQRLHGLSNQGFCRAPPHAQNVLLAADLEHGSQAQTTSHLKFHEFWGDLNAFGVEPRATMLTRSSKDRVCSTEMAALSKQLNFMSLELSNTGMVAAGFMRRKLQSVYREEKEMEYDEEQDETHCKAGLLRQLVAQVQAENEVWSQLQDLLHGLQEEMGVLNEAREMWEERALRAEAQLSSLEDAVHDWRCRTQSAEEEVALLQSQRQALKVKIHTMKIKIQAMKKHAAERECLLKEDKSGHAEVVPLPAAETRPTIVVAEDQPRHASVGTQEDYALCESIVHSRYESSSRSSSGDLGSTSQRSFFHKNNIKKSLDFSNSSNEGVVRVRTHLLGDQRLKMDPARLDFCNKSSDVYSKARHKLTSGPLPAVVELTRLESLHPLCAKTDYKEKRKATLSCSKENRAERHGSLSHIIGSSQALQDHGCSSKSSLPFAPTSTPLRLPLGEMSNSPKPY